MIRKNEKNNYQKKTYMTSNMSEENKAIIRRLADVWNKGDISVLDEIVAVDYIAHNPTGDVMGLEGFKKEAKMYRTVFPDLNFTIEDIVAEGDKVVTRWIARGTHKGELKGMAPTNKKITITGININRFSGGKIIERWGYRDDLGMMQQLKISSLSKKDKG
jgi:steroid delta-isomerase-like uncharacterized protein